jgi:multidrug efflux pump subunit AcrA (membrane-fusion protein)
MNRRARRARVALAVGALAILAGCGGDGSSAADDTSSTSVPGVKPGTAKISTLEVPKSVECGGATFTTFEIRYATSGAARVELRVDGRPIPLDDAKGTVSADVRCDPLPHDVVLFAYDDDEGLTSRQAMLETKA